MTKSEIVAKTLEEMGRNAFGNGPLSAYTPEEKMQVAEILEQKFRDLPPDANIRTCGDFSDLNVECCDPCHTYHPHDLYLLELAEGTKAWICCAIGSSLFPEFHSEADQVEMENLLEMLFGKGKPG